MGGSSCTCKETSLGFILRVQATLLNMISAGRRDLKRHRNSSVSINCTQVHDIPKIACFWSLDQVYFLI